MLLVWSWDNVLTLTVLCSVLMFMSFVLCLLPSISSSYSYYCYKHVWQNTNLTILQGTWKLSGTLCPTQGDPSLLLDFRELWKLMSKVIKMSWIDTLMTSMLQNLPWGFLPFTSAVFTFSLKVVQVTSYPIPVNIEFCYHLCNSNCPKSNASLLLAAYCSLSPFLPWLQASH